MASICAAILTLGACAGISKGLESSWGVSAGEPGTLTDSPPLVRALRFGDWKRAAALIADGVGEGERIPRSIDSMPVEIAAAQDRIDIVRSLVEAGWISDLEGEIALMRAAQVGNKEIAEYLIGKGYTVGSSVDTYKRGMDTENAAVYELFLSVPHPSFKLNGYKDSAFTEGNRTPGTLLCNIAIIGAEDLVKPALSKGAKLESTRYEYKGYEGVKPLWLALAAGHTDTAFALMDAGADPDGRDKMHKYTPLMVACITGNYPAAKRLVESGADVNAVSATQSLRDSSFNQYSGQLSLTIADLKQRTPLILAAENLHEDIVTLLLKSGADPLFKNDEGWSALNAARLNRDSLVSGMLLAAGAPENPLVTAICAGDAAKVKSLLPGLAEYKGDKKRPVYPLQLAVRWHKVTKSKALIDTLLAAQDQLSPVDIERALRTAQNEDGELLLYLASKGLILKTEAYDSGFETLRSLVKKGDTKAFLAAWDTAGRDLSKNRINLLLRESAETGNLELARFMLDRGADADAYWLQNRMSMLGKAAASGNLELVKLLSDRGAQVNPKLSKIGWVVYPWISPLMAAAEAGREPIVSYLLKQGAVMDEAGFEGRTALGYAALSGCLGCARILLDAGAAPDIRMARLQPDSITTLEHRGETALMLAAKQGSADMVSLLLKAGADPRLTDWIGDDALLMSHDAGNRDAEALLAKALGSRYP